MLLRFGVFTALGFVFLILAVNPWSIAQDVNRARENESTTSHQEQTDQQQEQNPDLSPEQSPLVQPQTQMPQQAGAGERQDPDRIIDDTETFMRAKLANSQMVMEGLVTEDFEMIAKGARQLKQIAEAAHWPHTIDEVYQHHSVSFRWACEQLAEQAERHDLQAAHYTYLHMSTTCIDCHSYVRDRFRVERSESGIPVQLIPTQWDGPTRKMPDAPQPDDEPANEDKNG